MVGFDTTETNDRNVSVTKMSQLKKTKKTCNRLSAHLQIAGNNFQKYVLS